MKCAIADFSKRIACFTSDPGPTITEFARKIGPRKYACAPIKQFSEIIIVPFSVTPFSTVVDL
ncbi:MULTISPECIES: hypothetical protein [unclassified Empedobacter]|uniref:hypothetical protein n=1 Tax=unclassified Empedobacter TaxID=2643773 RepID=UPI0028AC46AB|nr:hypothetical protein [Empedobacter sp.]